MLSSCKLDKSNSGKELPNTDMSSIQQLDITKNSNKIVLPIGISLPSVLASNENSIIVYDYGDSMIKLLNEKGCKSFLPLGSADNTQGGAIFTGIGFSAKSPSTLNVSSETNIRGYDLEKGLFTTDINTYEYCSAFNNYPSEIFEIVQKDDTLLISQNGIPCINTPRNNRGFSVEEFESIRFMQIKENDKINHTFKIPDNNEIISKDKLYVKTFPLITYDYVNKYFYSMINPTNQLLKIKIDNNTLEAVVENEWNIKLKSYDQNVDYTLNKGIDRSLIEQNLTHNSEIIMLKAVDGKIFIQYRPSIPKEELNNFKYNQHYFLCIYDTISNNKITYALDYTKIFFLNCLDNGDLWFYNIEESELSNSVTTIINTINMNDLIYN
ncbi:MAG: hypothetical protein HRU40_04530 [Saprospiraceae bacterium]|nr:hypothetical protein [Saprospiraceae bacterium]